MNEPEYILDRGTKIVTDKTLGSTAGILVKDEYLANRRPSAKGTILGFVPGHGGDIYWVQHEDESIAAYGWMEFDYDPDIPTVWERLDTMDLG